MSKPLHLLKFFEDADLTDTWNNMALIESDMYRTPHGAFVHAVAMEATDSSCWYVFEGRTADVQRRQKLLNGIASHDDVASTYPGLGVKVATRAEALAAIEAHTDNYKSKNYTLFRTRAELRAFNSRPAQA